MFARHLLLAAALTWSASACHAGKDSQGTVAVSGNACRDDCEQKRSKCLTDCPDDVCRSDCSAGARECDVSCRMHEDAGAGIDAGSGTADGRVPGMLPKRPPLVDSGMGLDADFDGGFGDPAAAIGGDGAAGVAGAAGGGGVGNAGRGGDGAGGTGPVGGLPVLPIGGYAGVPTGGRDSPPVAGLALPIAGMPTAGDAP